MGARRAGYIDRCTWNGVGVGVDGGIGVGGGGAGAVGGAGDVLLWGGQVCTSCHEGGRWAGAEVLLDRRDLSGWAGHLAGGGWREGTWRRKGPGRCVFFGGGRS